MTATRRRARSARALSLRFALRFPWPGSRSKRELVDLGGALGADVIEAVVLVGTHLAQAADADVHSAPFRQVASNLVADHRHRLGCSRFAAALPAEGDSPLSGTVVPVNSGCRFGKKG